MIIDGKKLACATCIKGHRASHCKHKDRPLIEIKKKGRPATQCKRCRELRAVRQLHVKCDCNDELDSTPRKRKAIIPQDKVMKEKLNLRLIAPKPEQQQQQTSPLLPDPLPSQPLQTLLRQSSPQKSPQQPQQYIPDEQPLAKKETTTPLSSPPEMSSSGSSISSCCSNDTSSPIKQNINSTSSSSIPAPTLCNTIRNSNTSNSKSLGCGCGSGSKITNQQQKVESTCCGSSNSSKKTTEVNRVRLITCRCGDSCACPGCDAHPSRAMKGRNDPYTGFTTEDSRRRLSIASICLPSDIASSKRSEQPTAVLNENGVELCRCGCSQTLESCSNCFQELCQDYYSNVSTS